MVNLDLDVFINRKLGLLPVITLFLAFLLSAQANSSIEISDQVDSYNLNHGMRWLEDKSRSYTISNILSPSVHQQFKRLQEKRFNQGFSDSNFWLHIPIDDRSNPADTGSKLWVMEIDNPLLESLNIYIKQADGNLKHLQLGTIYPFHKRPLQYKNFLVPINISSGEHVDIYIQLKTSGVARMQASLYSSTGLIEAKIISMTFYGLFFGAMISMIFYSFFIYLSLKEKSHLLYLGYLVSFTFLQAAIGGYCHQYLWPNKPWLNPNAITILVFFCNLLALQFCLVFLKLPKYFPLLSTCVNFFSAICIIAIAATFLTPYSIMIGVAIVVTLLASMIIIAAGIKAFINDHKEARFFLLAWLFWLAGATIQALMALDFIPDNIFTANAAAISISIELVLLSFALGDRINQKRLDSQRLEKVAQQKMRKAHQDLKQSLQKEEQNNRLKDQFLATISHELRTPMNGVEGALALIDSDKLDKKRAGYLIAAKQCARDMTDLVESILRFSEIQSGTLTIKPATFELRPAFHPAAIKLRNACKKKGLDFNWHIDKNLPSTLFADKEQLLLIINQLADNAAKFTSKGCVSINLWLDDHTGNPELVISVSDTGEGIPPDQIENIINGFHQVDGSDKRRHSGLGIGLAACHQLSVIMGGRLTIESTVGKGSHINFFVPLINGDGKPQPNSLMPTLTSGKKNVVLIAEDNPINQMVLSSMLVQMGCIVLTADNGQQAIEVLKQQPVDLIMMDCQMPIVDGFEATQIIRASNAIYSDVAIIAVTANAMSGDSTRCIVAGMNDYIKKPINLDVLTSKIARWLNHSSPL